MGGCIGDISGRHRYIRLDGNGADVNWIGLLGLESAVEGAPTDLQESDIRILLTAGVLYDPTSDCERPRVLYGVYSGEDSLNPKLGKQELFFTGLDHAIWFMRARHGTARYPVRVKQAGVEYLDEKV